MDNEKFTLGCIGLTVAILLIMIGGALVNGWALCKMWAWFAVPIFGIQVLTMPQAIGFATMITLLVGDQAPTNDDDDMIDTISKLLARSFLLPLMYVGIGWIAMRYM